MAVTRIPVRTADRAYDVVIGEGLLGEVAGLVGRARRVAVVHQAAVAPVATRILEGLTGAGVEVLPLPVPDGEAAKTVATAESCWERLGAAGFTRSDSVVGVGGGAATDLAGFVAASWLRGVAVVHVPTTLLGMVDAAVGGKTAVNISAGKNLVGAFHQPRGVLCDMTTLATLPTEEVRSGMAEVVKCGFIADPVILDLLTADPTGEGCLPELVERSVRVKADVVAADERESGLREVLNYGHTLAHAIEKVEDFRWRHGDAVAVGLCYAAALGRLAGRLDAATAARHGDLLRACGLPTTYTAGRWTQLHDAMRVDKKTRGARLRFIVLDGPARPGTLDDPADDLLTAAYAEVSAG